MHYSPMAHLPPVIMFFFISHLLLLTFSTQAIATSAPDLDTCPSSISFKCGSFNSLVFPFTNTTLPGCGLCTLSCNKLDQTANISCSPELPAPYQLLQIDTGNKTILTNSPSSNKSDVCNSNTYISPLFSSSPSISFSVLNNQTYVNCPNGSSPLNQQEVNRKNCPDGSVVYGPYTNMSGSPETASSDCRAVYISPTNNISVQYQLSESCQQCVDRGGWCYDGYSSDETRRISECTKKGRSKLGIVLGSVAAILFVIIIVLLWRLRMIKRGGFTSKPNTTLDYSESDLEINASVHYGVPVFSYNDLREATNHFDAIKEVGEGGFGTVYQGKLKDGREVAVKRLYEKNYKRIEQFINEIRLLTSLRHKNLVTLYGCTSQHSRELLLVYEYVPNGTVADHLHGGRAEGAGSRSQLTWPVRMKIAIETASALSYLHACDIVHRDVKTDNILLDNHFSVKVADFGLSRLFPLDVTHVSTAPQGTPGYVDPEYHQCFQLTDKSDVYSFGVVLIELLSSLPALDMKRDKHEISLATYAINRIKCCAFSELVDSGLGYDSDFQVRRMTMLVAELAFQCLQHQKELRPSMDQVLETLQSIENADYSMLELEDKVKLAVLAKSSSKSIRPLPLLADDKVGVVELLSESARYLSSSSPDSVMNIWRSGNTTPSTSS